MPWGLGRLAYASAVILAVGTTWCFAWAKSVTDESSRGYWPAKDPHLVRRVMSAGGAEPTAVLPAD
jgi:hypothetical protein